MITANILNGTTWNGEGADGKVVLRAFEEGHGGKIYDLSIVVLDNPE
jgi:hypothetical protein